MVNSQYGPFTIQKQINIIDLQTTADTFHLRLCTNIQALDIWTIHHSQFTIPNTSSSFS